MGRTLAAGALCIATSILGVKTKRGKRITQELISKKTGATDVSIRNAYEDIVRNVKMDVLFIGFKREVGGFLKQRMWERLFSAMSRRAL